MVFADSAARTSALSGVLAEGMMSYLQDTNAVEVYNGTAWVGVGNVGDITEVQAGVGISVASGTGPIPVITNSSTDLITTAGDLLYGTAADTVARLGIGTAGQVLKVNSGATAPEWGAAAAAGGKVLQVVNGTRLTSTTTTSTSYVDTNLTATITPSSATSKILVFVSQTGLLKDAGNAGNGIAIRLMRDSTEILILEAYAGFNQVSEYQNVAGTSCTYLDEPATTSAITYKTQFKSITGHTVITQYDNGDSTITLMEIGA
jgi:hypothetical protein